MVLKTSLIIIGDASVAKSEVAGLTDSVKGLGTATTAAVAPLGSLDRAQRGAADSARDLGAAASVIGKAQADSSIAHAQAALAANGAAASNDNVARSSGNASIAAIVLQSAIRKTSDQYAAGASLATIFGEHIGTVAEVLELYARSSARGAEGTKQIKEAGAEAGTGVGELGRTVVEGAEKFKGFTGVIGAAAEFLAGPWGIAVSIGAAVLPSLIGNLLETESASDRAKEAEQRFANTQSDLAAAVDKANGKLAEQNRLKAIAGSFAAPSSISSGYGSVGASIKSGFDEARTTLSGFARSRAGITDASGLALSRLISAAGGGANGGSGNFAALTKGVDSLAEASNNPAIKSLAGKLNDIYSGAAKTFTSVRQLEGAQRDANTALAGGTVLTQASIAQQIQLATAHDGVTRATAKLSVAQTALNVLYDKPSSAARDAEIRKAQAQVVADTNAVTAAQEAAKKRPKPKSTAGLDHFGEQAATRIADIVGQYNADPTTAALEKTNKQVRALDDLITDLGRRKPPNFEDLIQSAEKAKVTVRDGIVAELSKAFEKPKTLAEQARAAFAQIDAIEADLRKNQPPGFDAVIASAEKARSAIQQGLQRPYNDYLKSQQDDLATLRLLASGRVDEANALKQIQGLERAGRPLTDAQKDSVLATVEALRAEQREVDDLTQKNAKYLDALGGIKSVVDDATQAFVRGDLGQLIKSPGKLVDVFQTLSGRALFDKVFGGLFTELQDQVSGTSVVKDASSRMATALSEVASKTATTGAGLATVTESATTVSSALRELAGSAHAASSAIASNDNTAAANDNGGGGATTDASGDVVVTGQRVPSGISAAGAPQLNVSDIKFPAISSVDAALGKSDGVRDPLALVQKALSGVSESLLKVFTNPEAAKNIGGAIGKYSGLALQGAATGTLVAGIGKSIGFNLNQTGAQLGGAVGGILGGIKSVTSALGPLGGAIGPVLSVVGGLVGSLFSSPKVGGASITSTGVSGTVGTDHAGQQASQTAGSAILTNVRQIAAQLGGTLGNFGTITIGAYGDKFRVNDHGTNLKSNNDVEQFGTLDEAQAFALKQAIAKGAVAGLSAAVSAALQSSSDVQGAVQEALGVKNLQYAIAGVAGSLQQIFDAERMSANERLRLAKTYGVDLAATEKLNADTMTKLIASTVKSAVGSLQSLVDDLTTGSLFEGTAMDKISAINTKIVQAKADVDAGVDGAADTLSKLYQDRLTASKDAYGTTGAYAADRQATLDDARAEIASTNARITAAQASSDPALATTNRALDENNDQNSAIIDALQNNNALLEQIAGSFDVGSFNFSKLAGYG